MRHRAEEKRERERRGVYTYLGKRERSLFARLLRIMTGDRTSARYIYIRLLRHTYS